MLLVGFAELTGAIILLVAGVTGSSLRSVVLGRPDKTSANAITAAVSAGGTSGGGGSVTVAPGSAAPGAPGSGTIPGATPSESLGVLPTNVISTAGRTAKAHGWTPAQLLDWLSVIVQESGGNLTAQNPHSGAYGIAQFINGPSEYYQYGGNPNTVTGQITAMANYIKQRYGTPTAALAHERAYNWY